MFKILHIFFAVILGCLVFFSATYSAPAPKLFWRTYYPNQAINKVVVNAGVIYLATQNNGVAISRDAGNSWENCTTANGLASNTVLSIHVTNSGENTKIYAGIVAPTDALAWSNDNGKTWARYNDKTVNDIATTGSGGDTALYLASDHAVTIAYQNGHFDAAEIFNIGYNSTAIYATGDGGKWGPNDTVYTSIMDRGLAVSTHGAIFAPWTHYTTHNGLGSNYISRIKVIDSGHTATIYLATRGGLSIGYDNGAHWKNFTTANGLASNNVLDVYVTGSGDTATLYVATQKGLSISYDNGVTWDTNYNKENGLAGEQVNGVYATENDNKITVYAATQNGLSIGMVSTPKGTCTVNFEPPHTLGENWIGYEIKSIVDTSTGKVIWDGKDSRVIPPNTDPNNYLKRNNTHWVITWQPQANVHYQVDPQTDGGMINRDGIDYTFTPRKNHLYYAAIVGVAANGIALEPTLQNVRCHITLPY